MSADDEPRIRIGTSGWRHRHWRGVYYPAGVAQRDWLAHYAREFDCVEVDGSFYRLPEPDELRRWRDATPESFRFAFRAPRAITHRKKLKNCEDDVQRLLARLDLLGDRLGPVLFQLPARWHVNARRLEAFLDALPGRRRYAFELRDPSWHADEVIAALRAYGAALCVSDADAGAGAPELTADLVYVRLRGPGGPGRYRAERLRRWAGDALGWTRHGRDAYVVFEDDERAWSARNARRLRAVIDDGVVRPGVEIAAAP